MNLEHVSASLASWCACELGAEPVKELFSIRGTSHVVGLSLADGRRVVVKSRRDPVARAQTCLTLQAALFATRYPCPRPVTAVAVVDGLTVHAEELVDGGAELRGADRLTAPLMARALADLHARIERLTGVSDPEPLRPPAWIGWFRQRPWQAEPVVPVAVPAAAERVRYRLAEADLPSVVGHADWETQNLRWIGDELRVVHDWDSLTLLPDAVLVGAAAATFPSDKQPLLASIVATETFLASYQEQRGRTFTSEETEVAWAAGLLPVLFNARNEALENKRPLILDELPHQLELRLERAGA